MRPEDIASAALKAAKAAGADQAEAFVFRSKTLSAYIDDSKVKSVESKADLGVAMRVLVGGRLGQSSSSISSPRQAEACARSAVQAAKMVPVDKVFKGFAWPAKEQARIKAKDPDIGSLAPEDMTGIIKQLIGAAVEPKKVKVPNGVLKAAEIESLVSNTNELLTRREASLAYLLITAMTEGASPGEGSESYCSPYLKELDAEKVGASLKAKAKAAASAKGYKGSAKLTAILPPDELAEMLQGSLSFALSAENVNKRRSPLVGKIGKQVTSRALTLTDDPTDKRGLLSSPYDDEGTPTKKKVLVKDGVLKGFLYDLYNSHLSDTMPTGNGLRRSTSDPLANYQMHVGINPVCLVVKPGDKSVERLVEEMDHGLVVEKISAPTVHPITGDFGLEVRCGYLVEKGEIKQAIKHCLLSGNMFVSLNQIRALANDVMVSSNLILPSVQFEELELIGSE